MNTLLALSILFAVSITFVAIAISIYYWISRHKTIVTLQKAIERRLGGTSNGQDKKK